MKSEKMERHNQLLNCLRIILTSDTQQNDNQQGQAHAEVTSKCSQILETFSSFSMSYKEVISEGTF